MDNSLLMYYIHLGYLVDIDFGIFILQFISMSDHLVMNFADIRHLTKKTFDDIGYTEFNISDNLPL